MVKNNTIIIFSDTMFSSITLKFNKEAHQDYIFKKEETPATNHFLVHRIAEITPVISEPFAFFRTKQKGVTKTLKVL